MRYPEPSEGQKVSVLIDPKDDQGNPFVFLTGASGRFVEVAFRRKGKAHTKTMNAAYKADFGLFVADFTSLDLDLSEAGEIDIWVSSIFGFAPANESSTKLTLPTERSPYRLTVSSSQRQKMTVGILAGVVCVLCVAILI